MEQQQIRFDNPKIELEKLVEILDARHLWGQYHPAQGLKAQISKLEGGNAELREQIRKERIENELERDRKKVQDFNEDKTRYYIQKIVS